MLTLAVETSHARGSLAIGFVGSSYEILGSAEWSREKSTSEEITQTLQTLLDDLNLRLSQIERLAVDIGPGSFTGLRVGLNMVRALGLSLNKPIWTLDSLRSQAGPVIKNHLSTLSLRLAFRDLIYWSEYSYKNNICLETSAPRAAQASELASLIKSDDFQVVGDAWGKYPDLWPENRRSKIRALPHAMAHAVDLLFTLHDQPDLRRDLSWRETLPLYVRASEAEEKLRQSLLQPLPRV